MASRSSSGVMPSRTSTSACCFRRSIPAGASFSLIKTFIGSCYRCAKGVHHIVDAPGQLRHVVRLDGWVRCDPELIAAELPVRLRIYDAVRPQSRCHRTGVDRLLEVDRDDDRAPQRRVADERLRKLTG